MKKLITALLLTSSLSQPLLATCELTLTKRSLTSKTAYLGQQSISQKVQQALSDVCTIKYRMATYSELMEAEKAKFEKKMEKLKLQSQMK